MKIGKWIISGVIILALIIGIVQIARLNNGLSKLQDQLGEQSRSLSDLAEQLEQQGAVGRQTLVEALPGTRNAIGRLDGKGRLDNYWLAHAGSVATGYSNRKVSDFWDSDGIQTYGQVSWLLLNSSDAFRYPTMSFSTSFPDLSKQPESCYLKIGFIAQGIGQVALQLAYNESLGIHLLFFRCGPHYSNHFRQSLPADWRTTAYEWDIVVLPWGAEVYCDNALVCRVYNLPTSLEGGNSEEVSAWTGGYPPRHLVWMNAYLPPMTAYYHAFIEFAYADAEGTNCKLPLDPQYMNIMSSEGQSPKVFTLMKMSVPAGVTTELKDCLPIAPCKDLGLSIRTKYPANATAGGEVKIYTTPVPNIYYSGRCSYWDTEPFEPARTLAFAADSQKAESWVPSLPPYSIAKVRIENNDSDTGVMVCHCDDAWNSGQEGSVVCSADNVDKQEGTASSKVEVGAGADAGLLASKTIRSIDISGNQVVTFWIRSSVEIERGHLQLKIDNTYFDILGEFIETWDEHGNYSPHHKDCFGLVANTWYKQVIVLDEPSQYSRVTSIGIKQTVDLGEFTLHIDEIKASRAMEVLVNATIN